MVSCKTISLHDSPFYGQVEQLKTNVLPTVADVLNNFLYIKQNDNISYRGFIDQIPSILAKSVIHI